MDGGGERPDTKAPGMTAKTRVGSAPGWCGADKLPTFGDTEFLQQKRE